MSTTPLASRPKVFISHAHGDRATAQTLTNYLTTALGLGPGDIRCSSVVDHLLPTGRQIVGQLRKDIAGSTYFIALLSHFGLGSVWVKYESGAAWVLQKDILPILGPDTEATNKELGPLGAMPCVVIEDPQVDSVLAHHFGRLAQHLGVTLVEDTLAEEKLAEFIAAYRNWGGIHADFSQAVLHIRQPTGAATVEKLFQVTAEISGFMPANSFVWVAITNASTRQVWPKEVLIDPQRLGLHTIEIHENGTPAPGELGVCLLGVGQAGNARLRAWLAESEKKGNWSGLDVAAIPGAVELACVNGLTLGKKAGS